MKHRHYWKRTGEGVVSEFFSCRCGASLSLGKTIGLVERGKLYVFTRPKKKKRG